MQNKAKQKYKLVFSNLLGSLGYLSCTFQWLWVVLLYFSFVEKLVEYIASPTGVETPPQVVIEQTTRQEPTFAIIILTIVTIIVVIALLIYLVYKVPKTIVKTSKTAVQNTANYIAPIVIKTQHKKPSKKFQIKLTTSIVVGIKILIIFIPLILAFVYKYFNDQIITPQNALISSAVLALFSSIFFIFQYLAAWLFKVNKQELW